MCTKYVIDEYFNCNFNINIFVVDDTKHVMTFFVKFVNYRVYNIMIVNVEQFDNKIHCYDTKLYNIKKINSLIRKNC